MSTGQSNQIAPASNELIDHFFRYQYGETVSVLTRAFGTRYFDLIEDSVQSALIDALKIWPFNETPENPAGWIHRVARNKIVDALRHDAMKQKRREDIQHVTIKLMNAQNRWETWFEENQIRDSVLRMVFVCCHPDLPFPTQIALTLKAVCGFSISEIARALLIGDDAAKKRIQRAKSFLKQNELSLEEPQMGELANRINAVHQVLYLMFNEGYSSSVDYTPIREDLCEEAARLCHLVTEYDHLCTPDTFALLALMLFHGARIESRIDSSGQIVLLDDQDRNKWDKRLIFQATLFLEQAKTQRVSRYHLEAAIAMNHCLAKTSADTQWDKIVFLYDQLLELNWSPVYVLNRAVALSRADSPQSGLASLEPIRDDPFFKDYHLVDATIGELYRQSGDMVLAKSYFESSYSKAKSSHERTLLQRKIDECSP
jgi:RNA polymerase sigma factor (sigma-70 family)